MRSPWKSIHGRTAAIVAGVMLALLLVMGLMLEAVVGPTFPRIERDDAGLMADRVAKAVAAELESLDRLVHDWAAWDDAYAFVQAPNEAFRRANLQPNALTVTNVDMMVFLDRDGRVVWSGRYDAASGGLVAPPGYAAGERAPLPVLVAPAQQGQDLAGLLRWEWRPALVAARPITTTNGAAPPVGLLVMLRVLGEPEVMALGQRLRRDLSAEVLAGDDPSATLRQRRVVPLDDSRLLTTAILPDLDGRPLLALNATLPRPVMAAARATLDQAWLLGLASIVVVLALLWTVLYASLVRPLADLRRSVLALAQGGEASALPTGRRDEIGAVARAIGRMHERVLHMAHHDALTGLPNRLSFEARAEALLEAARRGDRRVAAMVVDLDHFKPVNDRFGHGAGDQVLCMVAERLRHTVRENDLVARVGGDEFVVLCAIEAEAQARDIAGRVVDAMAEPFALDGGEAVTIGCSVGVVACCEAGVAPSDLTALLARADEALYAAKRAGRGCYRSGTASPDALPA